ncbi:MAG: alpha-L-fucosidase [Clostridia bacterium]|nr:alpha-L-fucosidase [Clostridia bacterium]
MENRITKEEYFAFAKESKERRVAWFREARFGMFIHYGLFSSHGMGEWAQVWEDIKISDYEKLASAFCPKEGCADEWCRLAKEAGAKYAVLTTRHHEGFSLWDSKVNPFNSVNYGPHRDIVREFVDACRKYGLKIGLYSSLMDWRHPDAWKCMTDEGARERFTAYVEALNVELLSNYGKIDILWYDMPWPRMSSKNWDSVNRNYRLRQLQPDILINNRSRMAEDFFTPEDAINAEDGADWEACMTFNGISWGYVDEEQITPYSYSANQIVKMIRKCTGAGGNLLLNIGPKADGSVPAEAIEPLKRVGAWLAENGEAAYGLKKRVGGYCGGNNVTECTAGTDDKTVYAWNYIWPKTGELVFGGYRNAPKRITLLSTGEEIAFRHEGHRLIMTGLAERSPDRHMGIAVLKMEFDEPVSYKYGSYYPQVSEGEDFSEGLGN